MSNRIVDVIKMEPTKKIGLEGGLNLSEPINLFP